MICNKQKIKLYTDYPYLHLIKNMLGGIGDHIMYVLCIYTSCIDNYLESKFMFITGLRRYLKVSYKKKRGMNFKKKISGTNE